MRSSILNILNVTSTEAFKGDLRHVNIWTTLGITFGLKSLLEAVEGFYGAFLLCIEIYLLELLYCYRIVVMKQGKAA